MAARDQRELAKGNVRGGVTQLLPEDWDEAEDNMAEVERRRAKRKERNQQLAEKGDDYENIDGDLIGEAKAQLLSVAPAIAAWSVQLEEAVRLLFRLFLHSYSHELAVGDEEKGGGKYYMEKLVALQREDKSSLQVSARHLTSFHCESFIEWLRFKPTRMLAVMDEIVSEECAHRRPEWYADRPCAVEITEWPEAVDIRQLRYSYINTMIRTSGVVVKRSGVVPRLRELYLTCASCGESINEQPYLISAGQKFRPPGKCFVCNRTVFKVDRVKTLYQNFQRITVQESPGTVPPGRAPRSLQVLLTASLADSTKPGEEVDVLGIYKVTYKCTRTCIYMYIHGHTCTYMDVHVHTWTYMDIHVRRCTHTRAHDMSLNEFAELT
eukprot:GHVS01094478.1.p2 GENE.GHVS01094478.1~~GHVS01094478.1.p2  ORF type:complete len:381 (+),score=58.86 GHVS01094478.1:274-1416(+)